MKEQEYSNVDGRVPDNSFAQEPPGDTEGVAAEMSELEAAAAEWKAKYVRAMADIDNLRKRMRREHENAEQVAIQDFTARLLPAKDAMERGLEMAASGDGVDAVSLMDGMSGTLGMINKAFVDSGVEEINPEGAVFDPELHEAVSVRNVPDMEAGMVLTVFEKGYVFNGRLIRPAKVEVSSEN
jgi:molecular chaperone GrpE